MMEVRFVGGASVVRIALDAVSGAASYDQLEEFQWQTAKGVGGEYAWAFDPELAIFYVHTHTRKAFEATLARRRDSSS